ncbi:MAG: hypothetical protein JWN34_374 [Bryobacterales bacterium]|nr:hypothetical protein [Bryobacterales bacterium]
MLTIRVVHHLDPDFERRILSTIHKQMGTIMAAVDDLAKNVEENTSVVQSAVALLGNLKSQLDAAIASGDMSKVQALSDTLGQNDAALGAAIAKNTPVAPSDGDTPAGGTDGAADAGSPESPTA